MEVESSCLNGMPTDTPPPTDGDLVRLLLQALTEHGYTKTADTLQQESGIVLELPNVTGFRRAILDGNYDRTLELLPKFTTDLTVISRVIFLVERERYLELLTKRHIKEALSCLRNAVTPNTSDASEVQILAGLMMLTPEAIQERLNWCGPGANSREYLLKRVQQCLPAGLMIEPRRLERILGQALQYQVNCCPAHFAGNMEGGILSDHSCNSESHCFALKANLVGHLDEVWYCAISNDGEYLASASKDNTVVIWSLPEGNLVQTFKEHAAGVLHLAWSPDDKSILTCSLDSRARLWDVESGVCTRIYLLNGEASVGVWTEDGMAVIVASHDGSLTRFSKDGLSSHRLDLRCTDLISLSSDRIAALGHQNGIQILSSEDLSFIDSFWAGETRTTSLSSNKSSTSFLVNEMAFGMIALYNLDGSSFALANSFTGHRNERFVVRSCFAREDEGLIVVGSEDGFVFIYHRESGRLIQKLHAHDGVVNCVNWTDAHGGLLISASDDHSLSIWARNTTTPIEAV